jgi:hypothetical protein
MQVKPLTFFYNGFIVILSKFIASSSVKIMQVRQDSHRAHMILRARQRGRMHKVKSPWMLLPKPTAEKTFSATRHMAV